MLGKLVKYEFKNMVKVMLAIYLVMIIATILEMIVVSVDVFKNGANIAASILVVSSTVFYIISVLAAFIITCVFLTVRFYKTMYSLQGYLTHTLPVTPAATFHAKLFASLVWMLLTIVICILSLFAISFAASGSEFFRQFWQFIEYCFRLLDLSVQGGITLLILSAAASCLTFLLFIFTSCSIGQLFGQNKIVASVVAGIVLNFITKILSMLAVLPILFCTDLTNGTEAPTAVFRINLYFSLGLSAALIAAYYIANIVIVRKHINLE